MQFVSFAICRVTGVVALCPAGAKSHAVMSSISSLLSGFIQFVFILTLRIVTVKQYLQHAGLREQRIGDVDVEKRPVFDSDPKAVARTRNLLKSWKGTIMIEARIARHLPGLGDCFDRLCLNGEPDFPAGCFFWQALQH